MEELRAWLNGTRDYDQGVRLYLKYGDDAQFVQLLLQGQTPYTKSIIFDKIKGVFLTPQQTVLEPDQPEEKFDIHHDQPATDEIKIDISPLVEACKMEAEKYYKQLMNARAQLFALCPVYRKPNENSFALVKSRQALALQILELRSYTDLYYARLRYVEKHGALPEAAAAVPEFEIPSNPILLERARVNLVKSINKEKSKPNTPERISSLEEKQKQLEQLNHAISKYFITE